MSDKQRLIARLGKGRVVNQALLERFAGRISEPMAKRVIVQATKLAERGEISKEVHKTIVDTVKKQKTLIPEGILRPVKYPKPAKIARELPTFYVKLW